MSEHPSIQAQLKQSLDRQLARSKAYRESLNADNVLLALAPELLEHLEEFVSQHGCDCGHPACNGCERTRAAKEVINKAKGVTG